MRRGADASGVHADAVAAVRLRAAQRLIGALEQLLDRQALVGPAHRETDARARGELADAGRYRLVRDRAPHALRDPLRRVLVRVDHQQQELVSAKPEREILVPNRADEAGTDLAQQLVAGLVPVRVVDPLEI